MPAFTYLAATGLILGLAIAAAMVLGRGARGNITAVLLVLGVAGLSLVVNLREEQRKEELAVATPSAPSAGERSAAGTPRR